MKDTAGVEFLLSIGGISGGQKQALLSENVGDGGSSIGENAVSRRRKLSA
jgi:hypothetical protein